MGNTGILGFGSFLSVVFVVLKLTKVISWYWLWVLSPLWISLILWGLAIVVLVKMNMKK